MTIIILIGMVLVLLLLLVNFVIEFSLELVYVSLIISIRSSLTHLHGFQLLVWLPYLIGITFFCLYQQNKSSESKVKFRQASNHCKGVLQASKMEYANETKEKFTSQKLGSWHFWWIANSILKKVNLLYLLYSMAQWCCLLHLIKQNCLLKTFVGTIILMTHISLPVFLSRT